MIAISIIGIFWAIFIVYWLISAAGSKRTIQSNAWWRGALVRIVVLAIVIWLIQSSNARYLLVFRGAENYSVAVVYLGVALVAAGLALAVWARVYLGKNWGMPMSLKESPELVTSGPYSVVRNPIYTGMLLAMFGSALVIGTIWFVVLIVSAVYFIYSAKVEEKIMAREFPDQYPAYKKRTKALIPFVW